MKNRVLVLLSTYNGEKYIEEQLKSILKQKKVSVDILIRDDGSSDSTKEIIKKYTKKYKNITHIAGQNLGYAKSFWELIKKSQEYDYYAFCDQDDIWLENKLFQAIKLITNESTEKTPTLYTSKVVSVDNNLNVINPNAFPDNRVLNVYESFQRSIVPGCTFVFNNEAKKILLMYDGYMESHDWATYSIINVFGKVIYDQNSYIKYRIHENNAIGQSNSKKDILLKQIKRFFKKSKCTRSNFAKDFYRCYKNIIPSKYKLDIKYLAYYQNNFLYKLKICFGKKYKGIIFKIYIFLNRV